MLLILILNHNNDLKFDPNSCFFNRGDFSNTTLVRIRYHVRST